MLKRLYGLFIICLGLSNPGVAADNDWEQLQQHPVRLVADDWCPQHCDHEAEHKGYIIDLVEQALQTVDIPYHIDFHPWARGLLEVERGEYDGLLTPTVKGYPQFIYHIEPLGYQDYCFYTRKDSTWQYRKPADLLGQKLAYLRDSGLSELETYIAQHRNQIEVQLFSGSRGYTRKIFQFLERGRADSIIMTSDVYQYSLKTAQIQDHFRSAGCLGHEKLAVGLSRSDPMRAQAIAQALDSGLRTLRKQGRLQTILALYGLQPWPSAAQKETGP